MHIENLTDIDYRILKYFKDHSPSTMEEAEKAMPDIDVLGLRIRTLATSEIHNNGFISLPIENTKCLRENYKKITNPNHTTSYESLKTFSITSLGKKVLQDHETDERKRRKDMWLVNAKIPILVSIITTLTVNWLPKLLPLIQQWFSSSQP